MRCFLKWELEKKRRELKHWEGPACLCSDQMEEISLWEMRTDPGSQELPSADSHQWDACEFLNLMNWAVPRIEMNLEALNLEASQSRWILGHPQPHASHWDESSHDLQCGLTHRVETYWKRISFSFTVMRTHFTAKEKIYYIIYHFSHSPLYIKSVLL